MFCVDNVDATCLRLSLNLVVSEVSVRFVLTRHCSVDGKEGF